MPPSLSPLSLFPGGLSLLSFPLPDDDSALLELTAHGGVLDLVLGFQEKHQIMHLENIYYFAKVSKFVKKVLFLHFPRIFRKIVYFRLGKCAYYVKLFLILTKCKYMKWSKLSTV